MTACMVGSDWRSRQEVGHVHDWEEWDGGRSWDM